MASRSLPHAFSYTEVSATQQSSAAGSQKGRSITRKEAVLTPRRSHDTLSEAPPSVPDEIETTRSMEGEVGHGEQSVLEANEGEKGFTGKPSGQMQEDNKETALESFPALLPPHAPAIDNDRMEIYADRPNIPGVGVVDPTPQSQRRIGDVEISDVVLGKGRTGSVRLCRKVTDGQVFAIKVVRRSVIKHDKIDCVQREQDALCRLQSADVKYPAFPVVWTVYETERRTWILMDYIEGRTLFKLIERKRSYNPRTGACRGLSLLRLTYFMKQLILAVQFMHSRGVAHCDLKPSNIMVDHQNQVSILDFGYAFTTPSLTHEGPFLCSSKCGSPQFAAPEIFLPGDHDPFLSDLWALGVIAYVLVTGLFPFFSRTNDLHELMDRVVNVQYIMPQYLDADLRILISGFLQRNPHDRLSLAEALNISLIRSAQVPARITRFFQSQDRLDGSEAHSKSKPYLRPVFSSSVTYSSDQSISVEHSRGHHHEQSWSQPSYNHLYWRGNGPTPTNEQKDNSWPNSTAVVPHDGQEALPLYGKRLDGSILSSSMSADKKHNSQQNAPLPSSAEVTMTKRKMKPTKSVELKTHRSDSPYRHSPPSSSSIHTQTRGYSYNKAKPVAEASQPPLPSQEKAQSPADGNSSSTMVFQRLQKDLNHTSPLVTSLLAMHIQMPFSPANNPPLTVEYSSTTISAAESLISSSVSGPALEQRISFPVSDPGHDQMEPQESTPVHVREHSSTTRRLRSFVKRTTAFFRRKSNQRDKLQREDVPIRRAAGQAPSPANKSEALSQEEQGVHSTSLSLTDSDSTSQPVTVHIPLTTHRNKR